jgi:hypothetical protein
MYSTQMLDDEFSVPKHVTISTIAKPDHPAQKLNYVRTSEATSRVMPIQVINAYVRTKRVPQIAGKELSSIAYRLCSTSVHSLGDDHHRRPPGQSRPGDRGSVVFVPVRYRVASYSDDLAEIELWGTAIGSALDSGIFEQSWVIASIELVWVDDDWRVRGQGSRAGPAPASIEAEPGIDDLEGFREYSYGPRP